MTSFTAPKLTAITKTYAFARNTALKTFYAPLCTQIGATINNDSVFLNIKMGCSITVSAVLQTNNLGLPDGDLQQVVNTRQAIVNYV